MSLLLDALKQAALEKKRQNMLTADHALNNDNLASDDETTLGSKTTGKTESLDLDEKADVVPVKGVELSIEEVTSTETDMPIAEYEKETENNFFQEDASSLSNDKSELNTDEVKVEGSVDSLLLDYAKIEGPESHAFGRVELFDVDRADIELKKERDMQLSESSGNAILLEAQQKNVANLIENSNKVYQKELWKFYSLYALLSVLAAIGLSYQYFGLSHFEKSNILTMDEKFPEAVSTDAISQLVNNTLLAMHGNTVELETSLSQILIENSSDSANVLQPSIELEESADNVIKLSQAIKNDPETNVANKTTIVASKPSIDNSLKRASKPDEPKENIERSFEAPKQPAVEKEINEIVLEKPPVNSVTNNLNSAYGYYQSGDLKLSKKSYEAVIDESPYQKDALLGLAAIATRQSLPERALYYYQQLLNADPNNLHAKTGILSLQTYAIRDPKWLAELNDLLYQQPNSAHLHFLKANVFSQKKQWQAAQKSYFKAWSTEPQNPDYAFNLAVSLDQLQQIKTALEFYTKAYELGKNYPHNFDMNVLYRRIQQLNGEA